MNAYTNVRDQIDPEPPRLPICNNEAEQGLLGGILCDNRAFAKVADIVQAEHFAEGAHQRIFAALATLIVAGKPANPVTMCHLFDNDSALPKRGGGKYLATLARCAITVSNAPYYALIVADCALRRELMSEFEDPQAEKTVVDILAAARPRIEALAKAAARLRNGR